MGINLDYDFFSDNIIFLKHQQKYDFLLFDAIKGVKFWFNVPKLNGNSCYYFNLIIGIDSNLNFNVNELFNYN
jgi:hypothetical protein